MAAPLYGRSDQVNRFRRLLQEHSGGLIGYFGVSGIGKSALLDILADEARKVTPYVVRLDYEPGPSSAGKTAVAALVHIIHQLERIGEEKEKPGIIDRLLQRRRPKRFLPALEALGFGDPQGSSGLYLNAIVAFGSTVSNNRQVINARAPSTPRDPVEAQLVQATHIFGAALHNLPLLPKIEVAKSTSYATRPCVVLLVDTLEFASADVLRWLISLRAGAASDHLILVAAGRNPVDGILAEPLPPFSPPLARAFLTQVRKIQDEDVIEHLVEICQGIPFCLDLAGRYVRQFPDDDVQSLRPASVEGHLVGEYFVKRYLHRMREVGGRNQGSRRLGYVLRYGPVLRRVDAEALEALLDGFSHTDGLFPAGKINFRELLDVAKGHTFMTGNRFHEVVRLLALRDLNEQEPMRLRELHERAATYWENRGERAEAFYRHSDKSSWSFPSERVT